MTLESDIEMKAMRLIELIEHHTVGIGEDHPFYGKSESDVAMMMLADLFREAHVACEAADIVKRKYGIELRKDRNLAIF